MPNFPLEPPRLVPAASDSFSKALAFENDPVLQDVTDTGEQIYTNDDSQAKFTDRVHRLWEERGDFSKVSASTISKSNPLLKEEQDSQQVDSKPDFSKPVTPAQLWDFKSELIQHVGVARQAVIQASHLLDLLIPSTTQNVPRDPNIPFPLDSLKPLPLHVPPPNPSPSTQAESLSLVLSTTRNSLKQTANLFNSASKRLKSQIEHNNKRWENWTVLSNTGVRLEARGARQGAKLVGTMSEYLAKDLVAFCGIDEGSRIWKPAAFAVLEQEQEQEQKSDNDNDNNELQNFKLKLPQRTLGRRRLKVQLQLENLINSTSSLKPKSQSPLDLPNQDNSNIQLIYSTQQDLLDEELFDILLQEARQQESLGRRVELTPSSFSIEIALNQSITFTLVNVDDNDNEIHDTQGSPSSTANTQQASSSSSPSSSSPSSNSSDAPANILKSILQLKLFQRYKDRKISRSQQQQPSLQSLPSILNPNPSRIRKPESSSSKILAPVIDLIAFKSQAEKVYAIMNRAKSDLEQLGVQTSLNWRPSITSASELFDTMSIGALASLLIDSSHTIQLSLSPPTSVHFHLSNSSVPISSSNHLDSLLSTDISYYIKTKWLPSLDKPIIKKSTTTFNVKYKINSGFRITCNTVIPPSESQRLSASTSQSWTPSSSSTFQEWINNLKEMPC